MDFALTVDTGILGGCSDCAVGKDLQIHVPFAHQTYD